MDSSSVEGGHRAHQRLCVSPPSFNESPTEFHLEDIFFLLFSFFIVHFSLNRRTRPQGQRNKSEVANKRGNPKPREVPTFFFRRIVALVSLISNRSILSEDDHFLRVERLLTLTKAAITSLVLNCCTVRQIWNGTRHKKRKEKREKCLLHQISNKRNPCLMF